MKLQDKGYQLSPECAPNCDKISMISFHFVDKNNFFTEEQKENLSAGIKQSVALKRQEIRFVSVKKDRVYYNHQPNPAMIKSEINFYNDNCDRSIIKISIKIIYPDKFYVKEFSCSSLDKLSCVNKIFKTEVEKGIYSYLFEPVKGSIQ